jgi:hypothetical protein
MFAVAAVAAVMMIWSASALATAPVTIGKSGQSAAASVAVGSGGSAVAAWAAAGPPDTVHWCVLPAGGGACSKAGSLQPADAAQYVHGVQVLNEGSTVVILADVFGASDGGGNTGTDYENVQEWKSADGGQSFSASNGGKAVASGDPSSDTFALNAVTLPGGNALGVGFDTASAYPTFHASSLTAPTSCGRAANACPDGYATLQPPTNPDTISNPADGANFAANDDGVMGVYFTNFTTGPLGCSDAKTTPFGTAFVFGSGLQSPSNNYNVSPGQPSTAWRVAATQLDCNVDYPAVGGGPSGFGVIEDNTLTRQTIYHHFDGSSNSFDTKPVVVSNTGEQQPSVSQDGAGGVYAVYLNGGIGGPVAVAYSFDGGPTWSGPNAIAADPAGRIAGLTSNVNASGQGWATWVENGVVFAEPFTAANSVKDTVAASGTSNGTTVNISLSCASFPCTVTLTLTAPETVIIKANADAAEKTRAKTKKKTKTITLGKATFKLKKKGKVALKLSKTGRSYLAKRKGKVKLNLAVSQKIGAHAVVSEHKLTVKVSHPKKKKKKKKKKK